MKELEKTYNPADIEDRLYQKWLSCNIRRRHYDRERLFALASSSLRVSVEIFVVQPFLVQTVLNVRVPPRK